MTLSSEDKAEGICAALARAEAAFDKRGWVEMPKADRDRYVQRAMLAKPLIASALREACNEKLEEAALGALKALGGPAHTYASENADIYRAQDHALATAAQHIRSLKDPKD